LPGRWKNLRYLPKYLQERISPQLGDEQPWLNYELVSFLKHQPRGWVVEFGSGRSTMWLASQGFFVFSTEHDRKWANHVSVALQRRNLVTQVDYNLIDLNSGPSQAFDIYLRPFVDKKLPEQPVLVLVDGLFRPECLRACAGLVAHGTQLILHDADREEYQRTVADLKSCSHIETRVIYGPGHGTPDFTWALIFFKKTFDENPN